MRRFPLSFWANYNFLIIIFIKNIVNTVVPWKYEDLFVLSTSHLEATYIVGLSWVQNIRDSSLVNPKWNLVGLCFVRSRSMFFIASAPTAF
jgi:hypothetical protein